MVKIVRTQFFMDLILIFGYLMLTSCVSSSTGTYKVYNTSNIKTINTTGGYYDTTIIRVGSKNTVLFPKKNSEIEIYLQNYNFINLTVGIGIPIIPVCILPKGSVFNNNSYYKNSWIRIRNNSSGTVCINYIDLYSGKEELKITNSRYPDTDNDKYSFISNEDFRYQIEPNQHIWINIPERSKFKINITLFDMEKDFYFKKTNVWSIWSVTV